LNNPQFAAQQPQQPTQQPEGSPVVYVSKQNKTGKTIAIVLGSLFGVIVLFVGGMTFMMNRESQKLKTTFNTISNTLP
jgi:hypothetical protein